MTSASVPERDESITTVLEGFEKLLEDILEWYMASTPDESAQIAEYRSYARETTFNPSPPPAMLNEMMEECVATENTIRDASYLNRVTLVRELIAEFENKHDLSEVSPQTILRARHIFVNATLRMCAITYPQPEERASGGTLDVDEEHMWYQYYYIRALGVLTRGDDPMLILWPFDF